MEENLHYESLQKTCKESHYCLLDLNYSSSLLSTKIADIPHKLKYQTILAPIFEYCFGTSDQDRVWEHLTDDDELNTYTTVNLQIDWIRDRTFIYSKLCNLVSEKLDHIARLFGLWENRQFILKVIEQCNLKLCLDFFKQDRELMIVALMENGLNLGIVTEELRNDKEIVKQIVKKNGARFACVSEELQDDKEVLTIALESYSSAFIHASNRLKYDRDVVHKAVSRGLSVNLIGETFNNDRELLLLSSKTHGFGTLKFACFELRNDKEIVLQATQQSPDALYYASKGLISDREFVKQLVMVNGECLGKVAREFHDDIEIVELALKSSPNAHYFISDRLRKDQAEFISNIIGKRGFNSYLPSEFSNDREIVLESIKLFPENLTIASPELQNDKEFILQVVKNCGMALQFVKEEFKSDRQIVMEAITQNGNAVQFINQAQYVDDKEIIFKAAPTSTYIACSFFNSFLSETMKHDKEFLMKCRPFFSAFPRRYQLDREIVMEVVKTHPELVLYFAYPLIVSDRVLAMRIVKQDGLLLNELPSKYRNDREIVSFAIQQNKEAFKFVSDELKNDLQILKIRFPIN